MKNNLLIILLIIVSLYTIHFIQENGSTFITEFVMSRLGYFEYDAIRLYFIAAYVAFLIVILITYSDSTRPQRFVLLSIVAVTALISMAQYKLGIYSVEVYLNRLTSNSYFMIDRWFYGLTLGIVICSIFK